MATAETEAAQDERDPSASTVYDGFISYSHAADDLLAPRLQDGVQRFAKPWWKRRAVRMFRDESSLSANPHLWSSITDALDGSGWFVLLLSPEAAESPWVNNEVEYWLEHKDPERIIPVLTDGDFTWFDDDFISDAAPPALQGAFSDEPRWVDVRFARAEEQLDLKNPRFSAVVADIASAIRGVPKDELESEEVRQHRRTVRTAWGAGIALLALTVLAVGGAVFALDQRNDAETARSEAVANAERADENAAEAETNAERADEQAERANQEAERATGNAELAEARELTASSISVRDDNPELATLLAIEALHRGGPLFSEGLVGLREAMTANRLVDRREYEPGDRLTLAFTPDESGLIIASQLGRSVSRFDPGDLDEPLWVYEDLTTNDVIAKVAVHPHGSEIAVVMADQGDDDGLPGRIVLLDAATGEEKRTVPISGCIKPDDGAAFLYPVNRSGYSPTGSWFHLQADVTDCADVEAGDPVIVGGDTVIYDTGSWEEVMRLSDIDGLAGGTTSFTADGTTALVNFPFVRTELRSWPDFELLKTFDFGFKDDEPPVDAFISPDGRFITLFIVNWSDHRPAFWDVEADRFLGWGDRFEGIAEWGDAAFTADGLALVAGSGTAGLYEPATALRRLELHTTGTTSSLAVASERELAATASRGGVVELWTLGGETGAPLTRPDGSGVWWIDPNEIVEGERVGLRVYGDPDAEPEDCCRGVLVLDPETGMIENELYYYGWADAFSDGRFVVAGGGYGPDVEPGSDERRTIWLGPLAIWDPSDGSLEMVQDCVLDGFVDEDLGDCPDGDPSFAQNVRASSDGTQFAGASVDGEIRTWDSATLDVVRTITPNASGMLLFADGWFLTKPDPDPFSGDPGILYAIDAETGAELKTFQGNWHVRTNVISHDGSRLFLMDRDGHAYEYNTETWRLVRDWQAQQGTARGIALSPDGTRLAVSGEDGLIWIWQIDGEDPVRVDLIPAAVDRVSDIMWIDDDRMAAALVTESFEAYWQILDLSVDKVVADAVDGLVRGFTAEECTTYGLDPCPTLEEMKSR